MKTTLTHPQRKDLEIQIIENKGTFYVYVFQIMHDGTKILKEEREDNRNIAFLDCKIQEEFILKYSF